MFIFALKVLPCICQSIRFVWLVCRCCRRQFNLDKRPHWRVVARGCYHYISTLWYRSPYFTSIAREGAIYSECSSIQVSFIIYIVSVFVNNSGVSVALIADLLIFTFNRVIFKILDQKKITCFSCAHSKFYWTQILPFGMVLNVWSWC